MRKLFFYKLSILFISFFYLFVIDCEINQKFNIDNYFIEDWKGNGWEKVPEILSRIKAPAFPDRDYNIIDFQNVTGGANDYSSALKNAIEQCNKSGGGRVIIPAGEYFIKGPIHLKSNVNLHLEEGAIIKFSSEPDDYLPVVYTRWEGVECMNYSPLIYAYQEKNIAITGKGVFDGQASNKVWWTWKGKVNFGYKEGLPNQDNSRKNLFEMAEENVPVDKRVFGKESYLRPNMVQPYKCKNILIDGVTFKNSPMWHIHPVLCTNVIIRNVSVIGHGPNNDGCNPESCKDVLIKNCYFDNGDDCVTIKSGRNNDGRRINVPSENIIIQDCIMKDGHGGVVIGSEVSGGARYIFAENCKMDSPNLDKALRIKTNSVRGGVIEEIYMRNIDVGEVSGEVIFITMFYEEGDKGAFTPVIRNIEINNISVKKSLTAVSLEGYNSSPIMNIRIENSIFNSSSYIPIIINNSKNVLFDNVTINKRLYQTKGI